MTQFKEYTPGQLLLLPPSLHEWLPEDHLVYFLGDVVNELDLSSIVNRYNGSAGGQPPYHPEMMVKMLLYAYCVGVPSSRKMEKKTYEDVAFRIVCCGQHPDHDTIAEFRRRHLESLATLFVQVLQLCQKAGLVKLGHVALDSTKVKANASKHKAMSYGRMAEKEKELEKKVEELLQHAEEVDQGEDRQYGQGKRGDKLPEELRFHRKRLAKIRQAKAALEAEAVPQGGTEVGNPPPKSTPQPPANAQRNFTDPDSRIMKDNGTKSFVQGYNAQTAVDGHTQVIVAAEVTQEAVDRQQFVPMVEKVKETLGKFPRKVTADAGYYSESNVVEGQAQGIDVYLSPDRIKHSEKPPPVRGRIPKQMSVTERMRRKLRTKKGGAVYGKRKEVAEPVFGQIKQVRGFRQFLLRGVKKVQAEWQLICLTHNLLKLYRYAPALATG